MQSLDVAVSAGQPRKLSWTAGRIAALEPAEGAAKDLIATPGMIDLQVNGVAGVTFADPRLDADMLFRAAQQLWRTGTTHFLPTLITDAAAAMTAALGRLAAASRDERVRDSVRGFHLEGPYLSSLDGPRGAHPLEHCKDPDWDEFRRMQDAAGGRIRLVTLAPERRGAIDFIHRVVESGVRVALGHTAATREEILRAVDAGASLSTHLGNAAHDRIQRHHNYLFDQLGEDRLWASLIVDGHHLPPHVVKIFVRAKGLERVLIISDAVVYAGMPPGVYDGGHRQFEVRADGYIGVVDEPRLAGSGCLLDRGVTNLQRFAGLTWPQALEAATLRPAQFLGLADRLGSLEPGKESTFLLFHPTAADVAPTLAQTWLAGRKVFDAECGR